MSDADATSGPAPTAGTEPRKPPTVEEFLADIAGALGAPYRVTRDATFAWVTPYTESEHARLATQAAYGLSRVGRTIPGLVITPPPSGWPAILFASTEAQLAYDGLFGGEGARIVNGGMWRNWPVGHLAIPVSAWDALDAAFGHELVHAALSGTGVPTWLQEGLATELETGMGNRSAPLNDLFHWRKTLEWWRSHPADSFWSGKAFGDPESSRQAYDLAQVMALRLTAVPERLQRACTIGPEAWRDQDAVLREIAGGDRAALFQAMIGEGRRKGWFERFLYWCFVGDRP
jgi:hypothetical protein